MFEKAIINVIKPLKMTSMDTVSKMKKILDIKKAGHTGTLDPLAAGVLPICLGKATKIIPYLPEEYKEYVGGITLGIKTDTLDREGKIIDKNDNWKHINPDDIKKVISNFEGNIDQIPPMYSAIKKDGKRLYDLARKGKTVNRDARKIEIKEIEIYNIDLPVIHFRVVCSKGTYIRALARDIGAELKTGGYLSFLVRTESGPFKIKNSYYPETIRKYIKNKNDKFLISMDKPLNLPKLYIRSNKKIHKKAVNGNYLSVDEVKNYQDSKYNEQQKFRIYDNQNNFIAIYKLNLVSEKPKFKAEKVFV